MYKNTTNKTVLNLGLVASCRDGSLLKSLIICIPLEPFRCGHNSATQVKYIACDNAQYAISACPRRCRLHTAYLQRC